MRDTAGHRPPAQFGIVRHPLLNHANFRHAGISRQCAGHGAVFAEPGSVEGSHGCVARALASRRTSATYLGVAGEEADVRAAFIVDLVEGGKMDVHYKDPLTDRHH